MTITILGAGAFGTALGKILTDNGHSISYYDPHKYPKITLGKALKKAEAVIIAVPSRAIKKLVADYPEEGKQIPTILASKGLLNLESFVDFKDFSVLSGPAFAADIIAGKPASFTVSSQSAKELFANEQVTVEVSNDPLGIILCGALKNVYAIGAGYHADEDSNYINQAHSEMANYLADHGAQAETANLACGIGDLTLTCTDSQSRNYTCGRQLRAENSIDQILESLHTVEGYTTAQTIDDTDQYPILTEIKGLL